MDEIWNEELDRLAEPEVEERRGVAVAVAGKKVHHGGCPFHDFIAFLGVDSPP